jgi:hypothetical protein
MDFFNSKEDYELFSQNNSIFNLKDKTIEYCIRDVEIVYKFLKEIIQIINKYDRNIIKSSFSFSSIAYKLYVKMFDK